MYAVQDHVQSDAHTLWCSPGADDLDDPVFDGVGLEGFKSRTNAFLLAY